MYPGVELERYVDNKYQVISEVKVIKGINTLTEIFLCSWLYKRLMSDKALRVLKLSN